MLAEAASFALAARLPRAEAAALVKKAVEATMRGQGHLLDHLAAIAPGDMDWSTLKQDGAGLAPARALLERLLALAAASLKGE